MQMLQFISRLLSTILSAFFVSFRNRISSGLTKLIPTLPQRLRHLYLALLLVVREVICTGCQTVSVLRIQHRSLDPYFYAYISRPVEARSNLDVNRLLLQQRVSQLA